MKKMLYLLASVALTAPLVTTVQACKFSFVSNNPVIDENYNSNGIDDDEATEQQNAMKANQIKNREADSVLTTDFSLSSNFNSRSIAPRITVTGSENDQISTLATKSVKTYDGKTTFTPYADAGIVEDTAEYMMKQKGVGGSHRAEVETTLAENNVNNINYSPAEYKKHMGNDYEGIKLGFMQNASDTGDLVPMWNAAPSQIEKDPETQGILSETDYNVSNQEYSNWFNKRIDDWGIAGENLTISFGPFANSFWHTAWQNNKTPLELAETIAKIGERYQTKSFEFYFAAPYSTSSGDYFDSQQLLASSLKILLEQDNSYDFTLAMVLSTKSGVAITSDSIATIIGDEASALYSFTKYLGMNFKLNLVTYLTMNESEAAPETDWELPIIQKGIEGTASAWTQIHKSTNKITISEQDALKRIGITPWIGRRAEAATYSFTPQDAKKLREFAKSKNLANISMFYISRDVPSQFISNNGSSIWQLADKNPLDQNVRSGSGYKQYAYADALSGRTVDVKTTEVTTKQEIKDLGGIDYFDTLNLFPNLVDEDWDWSSPGAIDPGDDSNIGEGTIDNPDLSGTIPSGLGKSMLNTWTEANPNRTSNITNKQNTNTSVYFSPYIDAGLYSGNDVKTISNKTGLDYLTLAFVQQANANNDTMELSIAGQSTSGDAYDWWEESQLWEKMLKPLAENGNLQNVKTSYGGAITGGYYEKNPWDFALTKAGNVNSAVNMLEEGLVGFQEDLQKLAIKKGVTDAKMSKSIDFDIEGEAQNRDDANVVLAKTLAKMKKADSEWDFSLTLPVLPTGLTSTGYNVMDIFVKEFKAAGLGYNDIPVINLMLMDYGNPIYQQAIQNGLTNFDLAKDAIINTRNNLATSIYKNYGIKVTGSVELYNLIGATPMIGVNDTVWGVFTLEDAKEMYNFAHQVGLAYLSMWSMNDDRGLDFYTNKPGNKSLLSHGLVYLNEYDFAKTFNGQWDSKIQRPETSV